MIIIRWATFAAVILLSAGPSLAQVDVGRREPLRIDSARSYPGASTLAPQLVWSEEIVRPGATYLALHFSEFALAAGDYLLVSDGVGGASYRLEDRGKRNAGTFWARHVKGDRIRLELYAVGRAGGQGFVIDELAVGYAAAESTLAPEAICGLNDLRNATCYQTTNPIEYGHTRPVARLLIGGVRLCTGWLVSPYNHLLTNAHCISSDIDALNTDYEFMAEAPNCDDANCQLCHPGVVFSGAALVRVNANLDFALVQIFGGNASAEFGYLEIDPRDPIVGETIYIPQHAGGRAKELALASSSDLDGLCRVATNLAPACLGEGYTDVGYYCDTEGGSSGSPVLAASNHAVIGLHHCSNCPNRAVPIRLVHAAIADALGPGCASDADCDDAQFCNGTEYCRNGACLRDPVPCAGLGCDEPTDTCGPLCDGDGVCEGDETCSNCALDCISGATFLASCGNDVCELGGGENCLNCSADCNGKRGRDRVCCGIDAGCEHPACSDRGNSCTRGSANVVLYCCGDSYCGGDEDPLNCSGDCAESSCNGNGSCDPGENCFTCSTDCARRQGGRPAAQFCCGNGLVERSETPQLCNGNY